MHAIQKVKPEPGLVIGTAEKPELGPHDVLLEVKAATVCGTDLHIYYWDEWASKTIKDFPLIVGHEVAGEVVAVGKNVTTVAVGDIVSAESHVVDNTCFQCRINQRHVCQNTKILGVTRSGVFAEYVAIPEQNAWKNDPSLPLPLMAAQEPLGNAVHTVLPEHAPPDISGMTVLVTGCGPIGLMSIAVASELGAKKIIASETNANRLSKARDMGADVAINPLEDDVVEVVMSETDGVGVDVFLEMSGASVALLQGLDAVRAGGRVSLLGLQGGKPVPIDIDYVIFKGIRIHAIIGRRMFETWQQVKGLMSRARFRERLQKIVTHQLPMREVDSAMQMLKDGEALKLALVPEF